MLMSMVFNLEMELEPKCDVPRFGLAWSGITGCCPGGAVGVDSVEPQ